MSNPMTTPEMAELSAASLRDAIAYARANDGVFPDGRGVKFVREVHINELEAVLNQLTTLRTDSAQLREKNEELLTEPKRLRAIIERERTAAMTWTERIGAAVRNHRGISQSRGPYEWDDDEYFKEFGAALDDIERALTRAVRDTNALSLADCPTTRAEVIAARTATPETATCGKPAASLNPRLGQSFACVLTASHNGGCAPGGVCYEPGRES